MYGVGMEDEDEGNSDADLGVTPDVSSSSYNHVTHPSTQTTSSTSSRLVSQLVFK